MQEEESPAAGRSSLEGRGDTRAGLLWALASRGPSPAAVPWPGSGSQCRLHPGAEPFSLFSVLPSQCLRSWALTGYLRKRKGVTLFLHSNCLRPPKAIPASLVTVDTTAKFPLILSRLALEASGSGVSSPFL